MNFGDFFLDAAEVVLRAVGSHFFQVRLEFLKFGGQVRHFYADFFHLLAQRFLFCAKRFLLRAQGFLLLAQLFLFDGRALARARRIPWPA